MTGPVQRIQVLPDHVANQIAAGEVVERPASVVKELVENALDAQASTIRVAIERGGKGRIRVSDDGWGMGREDALICLDRHATSKIREADDLRKISSLGFRGEALPSIAAVSSMVIESCPSGEATGSRLRVMTGRIQSVEEIARRPGTTIDVNKLFLNTPVRARFLRSSSVETRAIAEVLHSLALANLSVRFVFEVNGRVVLDLPGGRELATRIEEIWSDASSAGLIPVSAERRAYTVTGVIQRPDRARAGFRRVHLFVNGRPFRDKGVLAAADRGYRTTVPPGTRPWIFLFLEVEPEAVDVNVHPSKAEVRFRDPARVQNFVEDTVREALAGIESAAAWGNVPSAGQGVDQGAPGQAGADEGGTDITSPLRLVHEGVGKDRPTYSPEGGAAEAGQPPQSDPPQSDESQLTFPGKTDKKDGPEDGFLPEAPQPGLLQIHNSFILAETRHGMIIVDQHAAHERILYERIIADFESKKGEGQRLLFPFVLRLTRQELEVVQTAAELLAQVGFEVEPFGEEALLVRSVPSPHRYFDSERCIREIIDELTNGSELMSTARTQNERVAMSFACKAAIKAGQKLSIEEMQELFDQLFATELPYHDVHGRPTVVRLGLAELRNKFGRS